MVMAPWENPIPLTRGWCLFELYCTIITKSKFEVAMDKTHLDKFFEDMRISVDEAVEKMLATIDVEKSECFKVEDRERT